MRDAGGEDQLALRAGQRYALRLERAPELAEVPAAAPLRLRADASYLITGGLGALGLQVARWMVEHGARRLVLMGRSGLPPRRRWNELLASELVASAPDGAASAAIDSTGEDARPAGSAVPPPRDLAAQRATITAIRGLERLGATVQIAAVDVADRDALAGWFERHRDAWPEIRGVVHAAGALQDAALIHSDAATFAAVARGKLLGALALDRALAGADDPGSAAPLDFFVSFSSAAALLGSPGQAAYAAANAMLDALAHAQRARGVRSASIAWGPWAESGLAVEAGGTHQLARRGVRLLDPAHAVALLAPLLAGTVAGAIPAQIGVVSLDAAALARALEVWGERRSLSRLLATASPQPQSERAALCALAEPERRAAVLARLRRDAGAALGIAAADLPIDCPLDRLGFESIMAIELRNRIRAYADASLSLAALVRGPTLAELADEITAMLSREQPAATAAPGSPAETAAPALSFGQQGLWLAHQLNPTSAVYNVAIGLRLPELRTDLLARSFRLLMQRHEPLRTLYPLVDGLPRPERIDAYLPDIPVFDLRGLPPDQREDAARALARDHAQQPFDLARGPILRLSLITLADDDHLLVTVMHHIATDGWSLGVLSRELTALYRALQAQPAADPADVLPALTGSYADYARWQRAHATSGVLAPQLDYWRRTLDGAPELIALPTDRPRPAVQSSAGDRYPVRLAPELVAELEALGQRDHATLFMTLLAGFHVVLRRYSRQSDICIGTSIAGRERAEWEGLIGFFVNNLVLRTRSPGDPSFRELLRAVRDTALGAYAHQDVPFETVVAELCPSRSLSHAPLHQVMLLDRNAHGAAPTLAGHAAREVDVATGTAMFDLTLALARSPAGLEGWFEYNTDLFDR
ncbi:MAG TPA: SDR family oxidoreductase, partial [Kofleriaceae bacterium]|nr:SDR family oxidoreductase [Kofleriaceae bacterium]